MADINGKKTGGRGKGVVNKSNQFIRDLLAEDENDPAKFLLMVMKKDIEFFKEELITLDHRMQAAKELMPYAYGKRKQVDSEGSDRSSILEDILDAIDGNR